MSSEYERKSSEELRARTKQQMSAASLSEKFSSALSREETQMKAL